MSDVVNLIKEYYERRGLKYPNFDNALKFAHTELAEVYELDLARIGGWIRNNPENKPSFSKERLAEELGDAVMMLLVAGIVEGTDPLEALANKIRTKLAKASATTIKGTSTLSILTDEEANKLRE